MTATATYTDPLTLSLAKAHLRIDHSLDDDYINHLIEASLVHAEDYTRRDLVDKVWTDSIVYSESEDTCCASISNIDKPSYWKLEYTRPITIVRNTNLDRVRIIAGGEVRITSGSGATIVTVELSGTAINYDDATRTVSVSLTAEGAPCIPANTTTATEWHTGYYGNTSALTQARLILIGSFYENRENDVLGLNVNELKTGYQRILGIISRAGM